MSIQQEQAKDIDPIQKWKYILQDYEKGRREKINLNENDRFSMKNLHKKHREFDPIIGIYLNPQKESEEAHKTQEIIKNTQKRKMEKGIFQYENDFDVFNRQSLKSKLFDSYSKDYINQGKQFQMKQTNKNFDLKQHHKPLILLEARDYDIVTHRNLDPEIMKSYTVLSSSKKDQQQNETSSQKLKNIDKDIMKKCIKPQQKNRQVLEQEREFDIITNEGKLQQGDQKTLIKSVRRYKQEAIYNPITQQMQMFNPQSSKPEKKQNLSTSNKQADVDFNEYQLNNNYNKLQNIKQENIQNTQKLKQKSSPIIKDTPIKKQINETPYLYLNQISTKNYLPEIQKSPQAYDFNQHDSLISSWNKQSSTYNPLFNPYRFDQAKQLSERSYYQQGTDYSPLSLDLNQNQRKQYSDMSKSLPLIQQQKRLSHSSNPDGNLKFNPKIHKIKTGAFLGNNYNT